MTEIGSAICWRGQQEPLQPNVSDAICNDDWLNEEVDNRTESEGKDISLIALPPYWLTDVPLATMDDGGYLTISSKAAHIAPAGQVFGPRRTHLVQNNDRITINLFADALPDVIQISGTDGRIWDIIQYNKDIKTPVVAEGHSSSHILVYIVVVGMAKNSTRIQFMSPISIPLVAFPFQKRAKYVLAQ